MPQKERSSGFEALRILAMLMIVGAHAVQHSGAQAFNLPNILLGSYGQLGVCVFVAISSYFLCDSNGIHSKKIVMICLQCLFISAVYCALFKIFSVERIGLKQIAQSLLTPFYQGSSYWFVRTYISFYLLAPLLQKIVKSISQESLKKIFIMTTILIPICKFIFFQDNAGSIGDFIYIFFAMAYLKKDEDNVIAKYPGFFCAGIFAFNLAAVFLLHYISGKFGIKNLSYKITERELPTIFLAISLFFLAKKYWNFKSKFVNSVAKTTLGIYILHENFLFYQNEEAPFLFCRTLKIGEKAQYSWYGLYLLAAIIGMFAICSALEWLRIIVIDKGIVEKIPTLDKACKKFDDWYQLQ